MYTNPKLTKAYRRAVACSPFCHAPSVTTHQYRTDSSDGHLYHTFRYSNPDLFGKPLLIVNPDFALLDHNGQPTGEHGLRWVVRIIDRNAQELWQGVFDPETEKWDVWELKLYHRSDLGRAMRGEKPRRFTNKPATSSLRARLTSGGHGCSVIHLQQNHIIGYDGVDGVGDLKYVVMRHGGFNERILSPTRQMSMWGVDDKAQIDQAVWWQNHDYGSPELNASRPMTWGRLSYDLVGTDAWEQRVKAITQGANTGAMVMWVAEAPDPHMLPRFTSRRNLRSNINRAPWDEAVYLVGREEKVAKVSRRRDDDHKMLVDKLNTIARMVANRRRPSGAMVGMVKRLLTNITNEQLDVLFNKYCGGFHYNERLAGYINHEIASRDARPKMMHDYAPGSFEAQILGGLA